MRRKRASAIAARKASKRRPLQPADGSLRISGEQFTEWQDGLGLTNRAAAAAIGAHFNSIPKFRTEGANQTVAMACAAASAGLPPYGLADAGLADEVRNFLGADAMPLPGQTADS